MPRAPWTTISAIDSDTPCVMVKTEATLRHRRDLPRFVASARTLWSHLHDADGLVGYELQASILQRTLSTLSAWRDRETMLRFAQGPAHQYVVGQTRHLTTDNRVHSWGSTGRQLSEYQTSQRHPESPRGEPRSAGFRAEAGSDLTT